MDINRLLEYEAMTLLFFLFNAVLFLSVYYQLSNIFYKKTVWIPIQNISQQAFFWHLQRKAPSLEMVSEKFLHYCPVTNKIFNCLILARNQGIPLYEELFMSEQLLKKISHIRNKDEIWLLAIIWRFFLTALLSLAVRLMINTTTQFSERQIYQYFDMLFLFIAFILVLSLLVFLSRFYQKRYHRLHQYFLAWFQATTGGKLAKNQPLYNEINIWQDQKRFYGIGSYSQKQENLRSLMENKLVEHEFQTKLFEEWYPLGEFLSLSLIVLLNLLIPLLCFVF